MTGPVDLPGHPGSSVGPGRSTGHAFVASPEGSRHSWPVGADSDNASEIAARILRNRFGAQLDDARHCTGCRKTVEPTASTVEHRWATRCGTCFERATRQKKKEEELVSQRRSCDGPDVEPGDQCNKANDASLW